MKLKRVLAASVAAAVALSGAMSVSAATLKDLFDGEYYAARYADLRESVGSDKEALWNHFVTYGLAEGRTMNGMLDVVKYRQTYADLDAAFGDDWDAYLNHYLTIGAREWRDTGTGFSALDYAERYQDLRVFDDDVSALWAHYAAYGKAEGRNAGLASGPRYFQSIFAQKKCPTVTQSVGTIAFPVFVIDFPDVKYTEELATKEELEEWIFGADESSAASYYKAASYGRTQLEGNVYFYTAQHEVAYYESYEGIEWLIMEALNAYDEEVDFSRYDANLDEYMDALMITVPTYENIDFWWAVTPTWGEDPEYENYSVDGTALWHYIINDFQPYASQKKDWIGTLEHEMGHSMGLPDYYKYKNYVGSSRGLQGDAGLEMMDDAEGDFSQFSKLQLGWLREDQVQVMPSDVREETFLLPPVSKGGCIAVFPKNQAPDFQSEYFMIEYNTPEGPYKGLIGDEGGVRVMHVQAEIDPGYDFWVEYLYKYSNYSSFYDDSNEGIRILKLVNDGNGYYGTGDSVVFGEASNFGWYDPEDQKQITDPGFSISIGTVQADGRIRVKVRWTE